MKLGRFLTVLACTVVLFAACGTTPGRPISFDVSFTGRDPGTFTTSTGWTVTLEEAWIALGPIYAYAPDVTDPVASVLGPAIARAHGGHDPFGSRELRGEVLEQHVVDALDATPVLLGTAAGSAGTCSDLVVELAPPRGDVAPSHGRTLWVSGIAERDGAAVPFQGGLDFPDEGLSRYVEGIALAVTMDDGGRMTLSIDVERWLDAADFARLTVRDGDRFVITDTDQAALAWRIGARHPEGFHAAWAPAAQSPTF